MTDRLKDTPVPDDGWSNGEPLIDPNGGEPESQTAIEALLTGGDEKNGAPQDLKKTPRRKNRGELDRLPPSSNECERGVIGCILRSPETCLAATIEKLKTDAEVFFDVRHQIIYRALVDLDDRKIQVDLISVGEALTSAGRLAESGGAEYLKALQDAVEATTNLNFYIEVVTEKAIRRRIIAACTKVVASAYDSADVNSVTNEVEQIIQQRQQYNLVSVLDGRDSSRRLMADLERRNALQGRLSGLDSGFIDLNWRTEGIQLSEQFIIGARPSQGKTALGLSLFKYNAFNGIPSLFISLEMSVEAVMRRLLAMEMSIPLREIRRGNYTEDQFPKFMSFQSACSRYPMHIVDAVSGMGIRELCSTVRRKVIQYGIKLVIIDYLQKIKPAERHEKKTYEIGDISGRLKSLAVECNIAMVTLAQLNRENTKEKGRKPRLADLADSGQIERDADVVGLLHKDDNGISLNIAKQRDGETGDVPLYFNGQYCRFENTSRDDEP